MSVKQEQSREAALSAKGVESPLYAERQKVYPQSVQGTFRRLRWAILCATLGVYYLLPFVRWDRGPHAPSQAVLIDMEHRRFYFFFIEIWPQEFYYLTGLLIIASMTLFLMNAVAGRVWCGYLCPQTIWTDLFLLIERLTQGDRRERMQLESGPWTLRRARSFLLKHFLWLMVAWWTGGAWVLYFSDAPKLVADLATFNAPAIAYIWIGILTLTTYFFAGYMREQVCTYMCPWPRIQAALTDEHALNVTYRYDRGEPRASVKKAEASRLAGEPAGDCIDCRQCFNVCPTGVDIRDGLQIDCIQCGLCIDACDNVMAKIGRPSGLIAYDTDERVKARACGQTPPTYQILRPRTILYAAIIAIVGAIMIYALATRSLIGISAIHDRNPVFVTLSDGSIRNAYTIRLLNKELHPRKFSVEVTGLEGALLEIVGAEQGAEGHLVDIGTDQTREVRVLVTAPRNSRHAREDIEFIATDTISGQSARAKDHFIGPEKR
ncbi:MAG: cytochrome c oxidase accessory protein CcoG [Beijerinckiaceae bacterium]|nr:cytochrome c oxidase accessory protein CcoG [Beijerinckiaceae bacterium]